MHICLRNNTYYWFVDSHAYPDEINCFNNKITLSNITRYFNVKWFIISYFKRHHLYIIMQIIINITGIFCIKCYSIRHYLCVKNNKINRQSQMLLHIHKNGILYYIFIKSRENLKHIIMKNIFRGVQHYLYVKLKLTK